MHIRAMNFYSMKEIYLTRLREAEDVKLSNFQ